MPSNIFSWGHQSQDKQSPSNESFPVKKPTEKKADTTNFLKQDFAHNQFHQIDTQFQILAKENVQLKY